MKKILRIVSITVLFAGLASSPSVFGKEPRQSGKAMEEKVSLPADAKAGVPAAPGKEGALQDLGKKMSDLNAQIMDEQAALSDKVGKWIEQRRALAALEAQLSKEIKDQEAQLTAQHERIEQLQKKLDEEKLSFAARQSQLADLKVYFSQPQTQPTSQAMAVPSEPPRKVVAR